MAKQYGIIDLLNKIADYANSRINAVITAALPAGTNLLGKVGIDQVTANANEVVVKSITAGDTNIGNVDIASAIPAGTNIIGAVKQDVQNYTTVSKYGDYTTQQTNADLWTPTAGKKFVLTDISVSTATAGTVTLLDEATIIREYKLAANGGAVENLRSAVLSAAANNDLKVTTSGALDCFIIVSGYEV